MTFLQNFSYFRYLLLLQLNPLCIFHYDTILNTFFLPVNLMHWYLWKNIEPYVEITVERLFQMNVAYYKNPIEPDDKKSYCTHFPHNKNTLPTKALQSEIQHSPYRTFLFTISWLITHHFLFLDSTSHWLLFGIVGESWIQKPETISPTTWYRYWTLHHQIAIAFW